MMAVAVLAVLVPMTFCAIRTASVEMAVCLTGMESSKEVTFDK
jgi:hypothetical protein